MRFIFPVLISIQTLLYIGFLALIFKGADRMSIPGEIIGSSIIFILPSLILVIFGIVKYKKLEDPKFKRNTVLITIVAAIPLLVSTGGFILMIVSVPFFTIPT